MAALVTGGASGLGAATAKMLSQAGAKVTLLDMDEERGSEVARAIDGKFVRTDITNEEAVEKALDQAETAHGTARILVNCAGVAPAMKAVSREGVPLATDSYRKIIEINLVGAFTTLAKFAARVIAMKCEDHERGVIINTASIAAFDGQIGHAAYSASKAGLVGMSLPLAREFARSHIRVMAIAPGLFETPILSGIAEAAAQAARHVQYPDRMGMPEEFARLVREIIGNPMLNGECIRVDGAVRLPPR